MLTQRKVTMIQPTRKIFNSEGGVLQTKKRVCAYARVSTDNEDQINSYHAQIQEYTKRINDNPQWTFQGMYADEGLSGTSIKKRLQFQKMIEDARSGHIDLILTKSISRFARNTVDSLTIIRELRTLGVDIFFEKENLYSSDPKIDFMLTIFSSIAQEESRNISENVKWGFRKRFKEGVVNINTKRFLGFDKDETGKIIIDEGEAKIVKMIFNMYLAGYSTNEICKHLLVNNIKNGRGEVKWQPYTINYMLTNEKYCGDVILQKRVTIDYLTHKTVINTGQAPQYHISDNHEPIISRDVFNLVQTLKKERASKKNANRHEHRFPLSGLVYCGVCHRKMYRTHYNPETPYARIVMSCKNNARNKCVCQNTPIDNELLEKLSAHVLGQLQIQEPMRVEEVLSLLEPHLAKDDQQQEIEITKQDIFKIERELQALIQLRISQTSREDDHYFQKVFMEKKAELNQLQSQLTRQENSLLEQHVNQQRLHDIRDYLATKMELVNRYALTQIIKKIIVYAPDSITYVMAKSELIDETFLLSIESVKVAPPILGGYFSVGERSVRWRLIEWRNASC